MQTQLERSANRGLGLLFVAAFLLAGCGNKQDGGAGGSPSEGTPAQVQQTAQQQAAQRAAYFNSHPAGKGTGQNTGAPAVMGHP